MEWYPLRRQVHQPEAASPGLAVQQAQPSAGSSTDQQSTEGRLSEQEGEAAGHAGRSCQSSSRQTWSELLDNMMIDEDFEESDWVEALAEALQPAEEEPPD